MDRAIPFQNKICLQKAIERDMMIHNEHLINAKSNCGMETPNTIHLLNRPKLKTAQQEGRFTEIERENK